MSHTPSQPAWFSMHGAAKYTGFSLSTIRKAIRLSALPAHRVGLGGGRRESVRIRHEDLDAWITGANQSPNQILNPTK